MFVPRRLLALALLVVLAGSGCGGAHFVSRSPGGGVVAVPEDSNSWPCYYKDSAHKLMAEQCPNGYEIVREETVKVGQKTINQASTDTNVTDVPGQTRTPSSTLTRTSSTNSTQVVDQTEWRITFKAKEPPR